jgi:hypothetical protein
VVLRVVSGVRTRTIRNGARFASPWLGGFPDSGGRRRGNAPRRATVSHSPDKAPGATSRGRAVTRTNAGHGDVFPDAPIPRPERAQSGARTPVTTSPTAARVGRSAS